MTLSGYTLYLTLLLITLMEQWPSGQDAGFPIQGSRVQNHWVAPRSTQPFILPWSIKWVPGISGNLVVKSKLPPRSGSVALRQMYPNHKKGTAKLFFFNKKKVLFTWRQEPLKHSGEILLLSKMSLLRESRWLLRYDILNPAIPFSDLYDVWKDYFEFR